jgi:hypothetical protein
LSNRAQYPDEIKSVVKAKYPLCRTPADRDRLADECGIGSRAKLYNLASRLLATRPHANSASEWVGEPEGYDATEDESRLWLRDDISSLFWDADDDRYLREHFGKTFIEAIGFMLNRTETACAYRARQLGLRAIPKHYDSRKVAAWLGLSERELGLLSKIGLELHPCTDSTGYVQITLISTTSLARVLLKDRFWQRLVDKRDADEFFIRDVIESIAQLQREEAVWEPNAWVSHGHTCLNPFSETCFGLFYDGYDDKMSGAELEPSDLAPEADVASDEWLRGRHRRDSYEEDLRKLEPMVDQSDLA